MPFQQPNPQILSHLNANNVYNVNENQRKLLNNTHQYSLVSIICFRKVSKFDYVALHT